MTLNSGKARSIGNPSCNDSLQESHKTWPGASGFHLLDPGHVGAPYPGVLPTDMDAQPDYSG
jgi:hypothetical protein